MTIDNKKYLQKLDNQLSVFSNRFMSNSRWSQLFEVLSKHKEIVNRCLVKTIWDNNLREIQIPDWAKFADVFDDDGIKDVFASGPYQFKEIEQLIFPKAWTSERKMRDQSLEPFKFEQDIRKIMSVILQVGEFELHLDNERLITYAYK